MSFSIGCNSLCCHLQADTDVYFCPSFKPSEKTNEITPLALYHQQTCWQSDLFSKPFKKNLNFFLLKQSDCKVSDHFFKTFQQLIFPERSSRCFYSFALKILPNAAALTWFPLWNGISEYSLLTKQTQLPVNIICYQSINRSSCFQQPVDGRGAAAGNRHKCHRHSLCDGVC